MKAFLLASSLHLLPTHTADIATTDKWAHAAVSANLTVLCLNLMVDDKKHVTWKQRMIASWVVWQAGLFKEMHDKSFDMNDIGANVIGIGIGQAISWRF